MPLGTFKCLSLNALKVARQAGRSWRKRGSGYVMVF